MNVNYRESSFSWPIDSSQVEDAFLRGDHPYPVYYLRFLQPQEHAAAFWAFVAIGEAGEHDADTIVRALMFSITPDILINRFDKARLHPQHIDAWYPMVYEWAWRQVKAVARDTPNLTVRGYGPLRHDDDDLMMWMATMATDRLFEYVHRDDFGCRRLGALADRDRRRKAAAAAAQEWKPEQKESLGRTEVADNEGVDDHEVSHGLQKLSLAEWPILQHRMCT